MEKQRNDSPLSAHLSLWDILVEPCQGWALGAIYTALTSCKDTNRNTVENFSNWGKFIMSYKPMCWFPSYTVSDLISYRSILPEVLRKDSNSDNGSNQHEHRDTQQEEHVCRENMIGWMDWILKSCCRWNESSQRATPGVGLNLKVELRSCGTSPPSAGVAPLRTSDQSLQWPW